MKVKCHRTVQNTRYYTYRKLNTSRDTLSSRDPCWGQRFKVAMCDIIAVRRLTIMKMVKRQRQAQENAGRL